MITDLPNYVYAIFFMTLLFVLLQFYIASKSKKAILIVIFWGILHCVLAFSGFYNNTKTIPPRFILLIIPMVVIIIASIFSKKMQNWLSTFNLKQLTYCQVFCRISFVLAVYRQICARIITFKGKNFDVLVGILAPIVAIFSFRNNKMNKLILWIWHIFSIILLINVLILAALSTPTVLQRMAFEQPNIAVMKLAFILLPAVIVPIILISNMAGFILLSLKFHPIIKCLLVG